jgi:hypothetical protein
MRRPLVSQWTPEQDERLRQLVMQDVSIVRAAAALRCTMGKVRNRARQLGCPFLPRRIARQKWASTPEWQDRYD